MTSCVADAFVDCANRRVQLVSDLPDPPVLTLEDIARLHNEAAQWRRAFAKKVRGMEINR